MKFVTITGQWASQPEPEMLVDIAHVIFRLATANSWTVREGHQHWGAGAA
jgi:hypothetical protein